MPTIDDSIVIEFPVKRRLRGHALMAAVDERLERCKALLTAHPELRDEAELLLQSRLTAINERLRADRNEVWRRAKTATNYHRALSEFNLAVHCAQRDGLPEASRHPKVALEDFVTSDKRYYEVRLAQLLTPSPDVASVAWKRRQLYGRRAHWDDQTAKRIAVVIREDEAFLKAHPARQRCSNGTCK